MLKVWQVQISLDKIWSKLYRHYTSKTITNFFMNKDKAQAFIIETMNDPQYVKSNIKIELKLIGVKE